MSSRGDELRILGSISLVGKVALWPSVPAETFTF